MEVGPYASAIRTMTTTQGPIAADIGEYSIESGGVEEQTFPFCLRVLFVYDFQRYDKPGTRSCGWAPLISEIHRQ